MKLNFDSLEISKNIFFILGISVQNQNKSSSVAMNRRNIFGDLQTVAVHPFYFGHKILSTAYYLFVLSIIVKKLPNYYFLLLVTLKRNDCFNGSLKNSPLFFDNTILMHKIKRMEISKKNIYS
jgi:hypothetical protein